MGGGAFCPDVDSGDVLIDLGAFVGTQGENKYGKDPRM